MELLVGIFSMLLLLSLIPLLLWRRSRVHDEITTVEQPESTPVPTPGTGEVRTSGSRSRMRRRPLVPVASSSAGDRTDDGDGEQEDDAEGYYVAKGPKKKDTKKQEKEARREAEVAARDAKREKQDRQAELRRKKDEEQEAEEHRKEEAAREQKAKEEEAANEEFDKWKTAFSVDTEGTVEDDAQEESQGLLLDFVEYIKKHKCVALDDLAAEFICVRRNALIGYWHWSKWGESQG